MRSAQSLAPYLKILVTGVLLFLVLRSVEPVKFLHDLKNLEAGHLALMVLVFWFGQVICAQRWRLIAASLGMGGKYTRFMQMYFVGTFFNTGLPSLIGGDAIKAYILSRSTGKPLKLGLASVIQDRAAGWITLLMYGSAAAVACPMTWRGISLRSIYALTWAGFIIALGLVWKGDRLYSRFIIAGKHSFSQRTLRLFADFHQALGTMHLSPGAVLRVAAISFFNSALVLWMYQQIAVAVGQPVSLVVFWALLPLITLLTMMPISLGGLGIREWAYVEALGLLGVPRAGALVVSLTTSALTIIANLAGVFFLPTIPGDLRRFDRSAFANEENPEIR